MLKQNILCPSSPHFLPTSPFFLWQHCSVLYLCVFNIFCRFHIYMWDHAELFSFLSMLSFGSTHVVVSGQHFSVQYRRSNLGYSSTELYLQYFSFQDWVSLNFPGWPGSSCFSFSGKWGYRHVLLYLAESPFLSLNNILLYIHLTVSLSIHWSVDTFVVPYPGYYEEYCKAQTHRIKKSKDLIYHMRTKLITQLHPGDSAKRIDFRCSCPFKNNR